MKNNYRRDYIWNTTGVLLQNLMSPLLLVVIAYLNGVAEVGLFSFAFAVSVVFWMIGMWGGRTYQVSDTEQEHSTKSYIYTRLILSVVILVGSLMFCLANSYDFSKTLLIVTLVVFKAVESISDVFYGIMQRHHKLYLAGYSLTMKAILSTTIFVLVDLSTRDILLASISVVVVNLFVFLIYDYRRAGKLEDINIGINNLRSHFKQAISILKTTSPVFIVSFLSILSLNIPRFFIDRFYDSENAYFGVIAMPITLILLVMTFILQPNIVALSQNFKHGEFTKLRKTLGKVGIVTAGIGVLILGLTYLIGDRVLTFVFNIDFTGYRLELLVIVFGAILNAFVAIGVNVLTVMRKFKGLFYTLLSTSALLVPITYMLVKQGGVMGGVVSFAAVCLIQATALYFIYRTNLRDKPSNA